MSPIREPSYNEIKNLALKLYAASKKHKENYVTDEVLKLGGYWRKARLILEGKRAMPKYIKKQMLDEKIRCPNCGRSLPSKSLIMECENCHKVGCFNCIGIRTYVDLGNKWVSFQSLRRRKTIPFKKLKSLPKKRLCTHCLYILDET